MYAPNQIQHHQATCIEKDICFVDIHDEITFVIAQRHVYIHSWYGPGAVRPTNKVFYKYLPILNCSHVLWQFGQGETLAYNINIFE